MSSAETETNEEASQNTNKTPSNNYNVGAHGEHLPIDENHADHHKESSHFSWFHRHEVPSGASVPPVTPHVAIVVNTKQKPVHKSTKLSDVFMMDSTRGLLPDDWFVPAHYIVDSKHRHIHREYDLNIFQRIFVMMERPKSCKLAFFVAVLINACIFVGTVVYVLSNDPSYMDQPLHGCHHPVCHDDPNLCPGKTICTPVPDESLVGVEDAIIYIFTVEYLLRAFLCWTVPVRVANCIPEDHDKHEHEAHLQEPDPVYSGPWQAWIYLTEWKCIIDAATIIPFYIFLGKEESGGSFNFIRILRLSRVLHVFKLTKDNEILHLLERTMRLSAPALALVGFIAGLGMVLCGSIVYFCEGGKFRVTAEFPEGQYYRVGVNGYGTEVTPFQSIATSMYWVISTATNTGYSDILPTSMGGRAVSCIVMILGAIIVAVPIGVIGSNFSHEYDTMHAHYKEKLGKADHHEETKIFVGPGLAKPYDAQKSPRAVTKPTHAPSMHPSGMKVMPGGVDVSDLVESDGTVLPTIESRLAKVESQQAQILELLQKIASRS